MHKPKLYQVVYTLCGSMALALGACCYCGNNDQAEHGDHAIQDTLLPDEIYVDTNKFIDTGGYVNDSLAIQNEIEEKYGVQWDFCDCVVKNDSIEKAIMETEDEAQIDLILLRMEEVDKHCKTLLTQPNTTPEQRDRHARKVRKCKKEAGIL
ncbi:MAG: hypothetical protein IPM74_07710 [Crocinitomicaceae bacterium]|nr:hypothetical protein [Crocinitomicaceae bacterium]MBK8925786.1 hypothetical protein [Crocinitomicaceae bacterium]